MYQKLREAIDKIQIIDDHAHPGVTELMLSMPQESRVALFTVDKYTSPEASSAGFPYLRDLHYEAYEKLYGFSKEDLNNPSKMPEVEATYQKKRLDLGNFIDELMDKGGVEIVIANYGVPDSLKNKKRIKLIPAVDYLAMPFDNKEYTKRPLSGDFVRNLDYLREEKRKQYNYLEQDLTNYLNFVDQVLAGLVKEGCVGFKFLAPYVRTTYFAKVAEKEAPRLYEEAKSGNWESYLKLQDYLYRYLLKKAIQLDLPVQIHFAVSDNYVSYTDPLNLTTILEDPELQSVKLVILHGGYPRFDDAGAMAVGGLLPNNIYIDISGRILFANHPKIIAKMLRNWLENPSLWNKILYGSDCLLGDRRIYTGARTVRDALYYALSGMIDENIINEEIAIVIAGKVLRENSRQLYKLG